LVAAIDAKLSQVMSESMLHDLAGVIHVHSLYSDGTGTVAEIAGAAAANDLDFLLLTDHDTLRAKQNGEEGWHGSVLVLVGEEVSPARGGHYLAFGIDRVIDHKGLDGHAIIDQVNERGGFGFLSHPFSKGSERFNRAPMSWSAMDSAGYTGLELWSFVTDGAEKISRISDVFRFIATPGRFVDQPPSVNLETWDRLCAGRRCVALGGIDAHQIGIRVGNRVPLRLMAYKRSFRYLRTHLLTEESLTGEFEPDQEAVFGALRAGHAYIAMDALAAASGFRFSGESGNQALIMGDEAVAGDGSWMLRAEVPRPAHLRLLRDGEEIFSNTGRALEHQVEGPGVFRIEAHLEVKGRPHTWILSNPIYLR
jgi:hypothetical protein